MTRNTDSIRDRKDLFICNSPPSSPTSLASNSSYDLKAIIDIDQEQREQGGGRGCDQAKDYMTRLEFGQLDRIKISNKKSTAASKLKAKGRSTIVGMKAKK